MKRVLIFDLETTGANTAEDQIIEIAIQQGLGDKAELKTRRVKPTIPIKKEAQAVHGISMDDLKDCPPFRKLAKGIREIFEECDAIMAYNARFDIEILQNELIRAGLEPLILSEKLILDPLSIWRNFERRDLSSAFERFVGGEHDTAHSAEGDVRATAQVFEGMLKEFDLTDTSYEELSKYTFPPEWIGFSHHLKWRGKTAIFTFGKYNQKPVWSSLHEDSSYLDWMKKAAFPSHVIQILDVAMSKSEKEFQKWLEARFPVPEESKKAA